MATPARRSIGGLRGNAPSTGLTRRVYPPLLRSPDIYVGVGVVLSPLNLACGLCLHGGCCSEGGMATPARRSIGGLRGNAPSTGLTRRVYPPLLRSPDIYVGVGVVLSPLNLACGLCLHGGCCSVGERAARRGFMFCTGVIRRPPAPTMCFLLEPI